MQKRERQYWAFCANPKRYNVQQAMCKPLDDWIVGRSHVRAGDRAIIWKAKGNEQDRGIVALAEILSDPTPGIPKSENWTNPQAEHKVVNRVKIHYFVPAALPLWLGATGLPILKQLTVANATGGTVFHVTPEQWAEIMKLVGGWPSNTPEVEEAVQIIDEYAGKKRSGQEFSTNVNTRQAVEQYAMEKAKAFYEERGWEVEDVSANKPYDLCCKAANGEELHVEVKGTTSEGSQVLLTANEVQHARYHYPKVALFIVSHIQVDLTSDEKLRGGEIQVIEPWNIDEGRLIVLAYAYNLPEKHDN